MMTSLKTCSNICIRSLRRPACQAKKNIDRRFFSSELEAASPQLALKDGRTTGELKEMIRHGPGDGVVTLNVGGSEFITLRSTLRINRILHERVTKAEANQEFTKGAVFIDRDPAQFGLILQHLRNRADAVQTNPFANKKFWKKNQVLIQVPKDRGKARDLFVEARYFKIQELEHLLCSYDMYTQFSSFIGGGSGNPFHAASEAITTVRRALIATSGFGLVMGTQNEKLVKDMQAMVGDVMAIATGRSKESKASDSGSPVESPKVG